MTLARFVTTMRIFHRIKAMNIPKEIECILRSVKETIPSTMLASITIFYEKVGRDCEGSYDYRPNIKIELK